VEATADAATLEREAEAAFWRGDVPQVMALQERAYRRYREGGDARGAGRMATALAWHHTTQDAARARDLCAGAGELGRRPRRTRSVLSAWVRAAGHRSPMGAGGRESAPRGGRTGAGAPRAAFANVVTVRAALSMYIDAFAARSAAPATKHARTAQREGADRGQTRTMVRPQATGPSHR
jgi:hypothetical protein